MTKTPGTRSCGKRCPEKFASTNRRIAIPRSASGEGSTPLSSRKTCRKSAATIAFLRARRIPFLPVGNWTNLIVRSGGYRGVLISLTGLHGLEIRDSGDGDVFVEAEAGVRSCGTGDPVDARGAHGNGVLRRHTRQRRRRRPDERRRLWKRNQGCACYRCVSWMQPKGCAP